MTSAVPLSVLLQGIYPLSTGYERAITGLSLDSRKVQRGDLFLACKGRQLDGRDFVGAAVAAGAAAVLVEADEVDWCCERLDRSVPILPILNLHDQLAELAGRFFDMPARQLRLIGITGTNGKTTVSQLLARALQAAGRRVAVIGTLGYGLIDQPLAAHGAGPGTTPDAVELQRIFAALRSEAVDTVVMEVSSHALDQQRVAVADFQIAVFTNLSRDHLDYHGSMEAYGAAKQRLFTGSALRLAILNADDPFVAATARLLGPDVQCLRWSLHDRTADLYASDIRHGPAGVAFRVHTPWGGFSLQSPLFGTFNIGNLLTVLSTLLASMASEPGFDAARLVASVATLAGVQGRMQSLGNFPVLTVVDYAHTPDGLEKALQALREHCCGTLWCVFGCGGDRDRGKRPLMGEIAERYADRLVLTDDNPRFESSSAILADIRAGLARPDEAIMIPERAAALAYALREAAPGSAVLIAGKGHEGHQEIAGSRLPFSDAEQALSVLKERFGSGAFAEAAR